MIITRAVIRVKPIQNLTSFRGKSLCSYAKRVLFQGERPSAIFI